MKKLLTSSLFRNTTRKVFIITVSSSYKKKFLVHTKRAAKLQLSCHNPLTMAPNLENTNVPTILFATGALIGKIYRNAFWNCLLPFFTTRSTWAHNQFFSSHSLLMLICLGCKNKMNGGAKGTGKKYKVSSRLNAPYTTVASNVFIPKIFRSYFPLYYCYYRHHRVLITDCANAIYSYAFITTTPIINSATIRRKRLTKKAAPTHCDRKAYILV